MVLCFYENAREVRYVFGRPIPFIPKLANRLESDDPEVHFKALEEAAKLAR